MIDVKRLRELLAAASPPVAFRHDATTRVVCGSDGRLVVTSSFVDAINALPALLDVYEAACRWADDPDSTDQELLDEIEKARSQCATGGDDNGDS